MFQHKFSFALEGGHYLEMFDKSRSSGQFGDYKFKQQVYVDLKNSTIRKAKKLVSNENLKKLAEKIEGIHGMKFYWLGTAAYQNNDEALLNFNEV